MDAWSSESGVTGWLRKNPRKIFGDHHPKSRAVMTRAGRFGSMAFAHARLTTMNYV